MATDEDGASPPDATEAVDVRDVVRELSQLLDVREGHTDEVDAVILPDVPTDEVRADSGDQTIAGESITGPSDMLDDSGSESLQRADPTMALQAIHLGEHENTGENEMEEEDEPETEARAPVAQAPRIGVLTWLAEEALDGLFLEGVPRAVATGEVIAVQGQAATRLMVVLEGRFRATANGRVVDALVPGDVYGATMVTDGIFGATVDAVEPGRVLEVSVESVKTWAGRYSLGVHWLHQVVSRRAHAAFLLSAPALAKVSRDRLARRAEECTERPVGEHTTLFEAGGPTGPAFIILEGRFRQTAAGPGGATTAPTIGDTLGLVSATKGTARTSTVVAMTDARVLEIPPAFLSALATTPIPKAPSVANARSPTPAPVPSSSVLPPLAEPAPPASAIAPLVETSAWSWLMTAVRPHRARFVLSIVFAIVSGVAAVVPPLLLEPMIDRAIVDADAAVFSSVLVALSVALIVVATARALSRTMAARAAGFAEGVLDDRLTEIVLLANVRIDAVEAAARLDRLRPLAKDGARAVGTAALGAVQLGLALAAVATLELQLVLVLTAVIAIALVLTVVFGARVQAAAEADDRVGLAYDVRRRALLEARDPVVSTGRAHFLDLRRARGRHLRGQAGANRVGAEAIGFSLVQIIGVIGLIVYVWLGGRLAQQSGITIGVFVAGGLLFLAALDALRLLYDSALTRARIQAAFRLAIDLIAPSSGTVVPTTDPTSIRGLVRLQGVVVTGRGPADPDVKVSEFLIRAGEHVVLVGASGAGQDQIAGVIGGAVTPVSGDVLLDDTPLAGLDPSARAQRVQFVSANRSIVHGTVLENLTLTATPQVERASAVAAEVGLADLVGALPLGFETMVGGDGPPLAMTEERRITIGRALYLDPPVLVLAGALDAVDAPTARGLIDAIQRVRRGRTTILSTVRPALAAHADRVVVMRGGEIVERGTPAELGARGDAFRGLL